MCPHVSTYVGGVGHVLANIRIHEETEYVRTGVAFAPQDDILMAFAGRGWKGHASMYVCLQGCMCCMHACVHEHTLAPKAAQLL